MPVEAKIRFASIDLNIPKSKLAHSQLQAFKKKLLNYYECSGVSDRGEYWTFHIHDTAYMSPDLAKSAAKDILWKMEHE